MLAMLTSVLEALIGKLDIKRHSPEHSIDTIHVLYNARLTSKPRSILI